MKNSFNLNDVDDRLANVERLLKTLRQQVAEVAEHVRIAAEQFRRAPAAARKGRKAPAQRTSVNGRGRQS